MSSPTSPLLDLKFFASNGIGSPELLTYLAQHSRELRRELTESLRHHLVAFTRSPSHYSPLFTGNELRVDVSAECEIALTILEYGQHGELLSTLASDVVLLNLGLQTLGIEHYELPAGWTHEPFDAQAQLHACAPLSLAPGQAAYHIAHNHNFHLLTVGFFGAGYRTHIATFDPTRIEGDPIGQKAHLSEPREVQLATGTLIHFEAHTDVHTQLPTDELSISINLMPKQPTVHVTEQYEFDMPSDRILRYVNGQVSHRVKLIELLGMLGGRAYADELCMLAERFPCARTRRQCLVELSAFRSTDDLAKLARRDDSALVRSLTQDWTP